MQSSDFLTALADLNTADPDNLQDFLDATQAQPSANLPKLVPIGTHDSIQYFIKSSDKTVHQDPKSAAIPATQIDDVFYGISSYEAKSIPDGQTIPTNLNYGFGLGRLYHESSTSVGIEDTGFYVICNAIDKSIWVTFDFEPYGETGEITPVQPECGDPYGELPLDTQKMKIGLMRLFGKEWIGRKPRSLDGGDPFRDGEGIPLACKLVAKPAFIADVLDAIKVGNAEPVLSGSSRDPEAS